MTGSPRPRAPLRGRSGAGDAPALCALGAAGLVLLLAGSASATQPSPPVTFTAPYHGKIVPAYRNFTASLWGGGCGANGSLPGVRNFEEATGLVGVHAAGSLVPCGNSSATQAIVFYNFHGIGLALRPTVPLAHPVRVVVVNWTFSYRIALNVTATPKKTTGAEAVIYINTCLSPIYSGGCLSNHGPNYWYSASVLSLWTTGGSLNASATNRSITERIGTYFAAHTRIQVLTEVAVEFGLFGDDPALDGAAGDLDMSGHGLGARLVSVTVG